jgi:hypothetical protein
MVSARWMAFASAASRFFRFSNAASLAALCDVDAGGPGGAASAANIQRNDPVSTSTTTQRDVEYGAVLAKQQQTERQHT